MEEMLSKKNGKATRQFMSCVKGARSWEMMSSEEKDISVGRSSVNDIGEAHFSVLKYKNQKYGTNLSTLSAGGVATAKTTGFTKWIIGSNNGKVGYWYTLERLKQEVLVVYGEHLASMTSKEY
jgi:hypothetical protein